ncbi:uncharacterized protein TRIADDRAFT_31500 [Trichoplax adhaerens]|uniref:ornithine decarboxylase n=1 Tax=Trichoplax adhaerens TaxID=10228 RepID=B3S9G9_TRIAD|nr:hypothetical protein TRIADDRAFT_31500 [Trichoplax adhaerens]EDV20648.1 hypothetical protein TRIADDRAFT_31500 [Trichoplax adhaerens]|eukprot:XP_002116848.1 hypothetical protein TRIADDRAFT_31500 [Trichoplax adhaerens]
MALINTLQKKNDDEPFYLVDIGDVIYKYVTWTSMMPGIRPYFALKCHPDFQIIATLCSLGAGLDVASAGEIEIARALGLQDEDVVYSNTCKGISHIRAAAKEGLTQMSFDSEVELQRIKLTFPNAKLLIRLLVDDSHSILKTGAKAGTPFSRVSHLFKVAKELGLNVVGTSFHIGSGCHDPSAFTKAIEKSKKAFDIAKEQGLELKVLDIGGGFPGHANTLFENMCHAVNQAIDIHFPADSGVKIIAEPGRFFAHTSSTLVANIIGKRLRYSDDDVQIEGTEMLYHINDGLIGSFLGTILARQKYLPQQLIPTKGKSYRSSLWGPSCGAMDCLLSDCNLPEMEAGEWVYYEDMGAYTSCLTTNFNGFKNTTRYYYINEKYWYDLPFSSML